MDSRPMATRAKYMLRFLPDKAYIRLYYRAKFHSRCDLKHPETYNEKLNWLKLYDHRPEYSRMVDKYESKRYVADLIGEEYIIPTLGVWDTFDEIDFDALPQQFVLKCTHDSAGLAIVRDKNSFDRAAARESLTKSLKTNFYYSSREWPYKTLKPRILAEQYMEDSRYGELRDYKFFCFDGVPKVMYVVSGRLEHKTTLDYFDLDFHHLDIQQNYPNTTKQLERPESFEQMKRLAHELSKGYPHIRVDFYEVNGAPYFGELTLYTFGGLEPFHPDRWDRVFGDWLVLPDKD